MSDERDAELTRDLEALVAAKEKQQRLMRICFLSAAADAVLAVVMHHHLFITLFLVALAILGIVFGMRAHLRAGALRGQAMEKILAEAFRRAGQEPPQAQA